MTKHDERRALWLGMLPKLRLHKRRAVLMLELPLQSRQLEASTAPRRRL